MCRDLSPPQSRPARRMPRVRTCSGPKSRISYMSRNSPALETRLTSPESEGEPRPKDVSCSPTGLIRTAGVPEVGRRIAPAVRPFTRRATVHRKHRLPRLSDKRWRMGEPVISVLVVDGHQTFAELLGVALRGQPDLRYVGHARTGAEALSLVGELRPDVVLLDPELSDSDGIASAALMRHRYPRP